RRVLFRSGIDIVGLLVPPYQVLEGVLPHLLAAGVKIPVLLPHRLLGGILGMLSVDVHHLVLKSAAPGVRRSPLAVCIPATTSNPARRKGASCGDPSPYRLRCCPPCTIPARSPSSTPCTLGPPAAVFRRSPSAVSRLSA